MRQKNRHMQLGLAAFLTVGSILVFWDTLFGSGVLLKIGRQFLVAVQPILFGAMFAYLLAPVVNFFEDHLLAAARKPPRRAGVRASLGIRSVSLLLTWSVVLFLCYLLASVLMPELYKSVMQLIDNVELYYRTVSGWVENLLEANPEVETWVASQMDTYFLKAREWLDTEFIPQAKALMGVVSGGVVSTVVNLVNFLKNLLVGVIVSVYLMATKEDCAAYSRKVLYGLFPRESVRWILRGVRKVDAIFSGFVRGKLLDSLIIGVLCFLGCSILKFPYTPLVSVIVGVTNVIPFFGPFLGAIPSTFLILLVSPKQAFFFVLFVLFLQQLDGNVIGPKILGDKTGLSSLWVIIAILIGGSFFGLAGMFFGVPVCACVYSAWDFYVNARLRKKHLPLETESYAGPQPETAPPPKETSPADTEDQ